MSSFLDQTVNEDAERFALSVGKAIHHFGAIEFLVNELLFHFIYDEIIKREVIKFTVSKRIDFLFAYLYKNINFLISKEYDVNKLNKIHDDVKNIFKERNKIAHNPFIVKSSIVNGARKIVSGINIIRYAGNKMGEEFLDINYLNDIVTESGNVFNEFACLIQIYDDSK